MNDIIKKAQHGDKQAFSQLVHLHMQTMYKTAWAYLGNDEDAADVIQETILACYEKLDTLRHPRYFKTWLTRILINKCKDFLKLRSRQTLTEIFSEPSYEENQLRMRMEGSAFLPGRKIPHRIGVILRPAHERQGNRRFARFKRKHSHDAACPRQRKAAPGI